MKIYLVTRSQGDYDENRYITMNTWKDKRDAEKYIERCKKVFPRLHDFYAEITSNKDYLHPLKETAYSRASIYEPAKFYIEEHELR